MAPYDSLEQEKTETPIALNLKCVRKTHPKPARHVTLLGYFLRKAFAFHIPSLPRLPGLSRIWVAHLSTR